MKSFGEFSHGSLYEAQINQSVKSAVFCWGRFNPPSRGHQKVFDHAYELAQENESSFYIFTSQTSDDDKNPLDYTRKIKALHKYFPQYAINIVKNSDIKTLFDAARTLQKNNFTKATLVVGEDRYDLFRKQMRDYFSEDIRITVESAGDREIGGDDPNLVSNISGQMLRDFARKNDLKSFITGSPKADIEIVKDVFYDIRRRYGLSNTSKSHTSIEASEEREEFFNGNYLEGAKVIRKETNQIGEIKEIGSNFLGIQFLGEEKIKRVWPSEVIKL